MKPAVYSVSGELTNPKFAEAFAKGCGGALVADSRDAPDLP